MCFLIGDDVESAGTLEVEAMGSMAYWAADLQMYSMLQRRRSDEVSYGAESSALRNWAHCFVSPHRPCATTSKCTGVVMSPSELFHDALRVVRGERVELTFENAPFLLSLQLERKR